MIPIAVMLEIYMYLTASVPWETIESMLTLAVRAKKKN